MGENVDFIWILFSQVRYFVAVATASTKVISNTKVGSDLSINPIFFCTKVGGKRLPYSTLLNNISSINLEII